MEYIPPLITGLTLLMLCLIYRLFIELFEIFLEDLD